MRQFAAGPAPVSAKGRVTNMKVTLLAHTPQPEHILAAAARLCYSVSYTHLTLPTNREV